MAQTSYVYLIRQFDNLSDITDSVLDEIRKTFAKAGDDIKISRNPNTALIIRSSGPMQKSVADHIVALNPTIEYDQVEYYLGAIKGELPGHKPATDPDGSAYLYAGRQYNALSDLTPDALSMVQNSYPDDNFACLLFRKLGDPMEQADADADVNDNPTIPLDDDPYDQGSVKGTPPGSTAALDRRFAFNKKNTGYTIRQFQHLSDVCNHGIGDIAPGFPVYLHYIAAPTRNKNKNKTSKPRS